MFTAECNPVRFVKNKVRAAAFVLFPVLLAVAAVSKTAPAASEGDLLTERSTVGDILRCPEFQGFAEKMLPYDNPHGNSSDVPLLEIGRLMPYHDNIAVSDVAAALNHMIGAIRKGDRVFFDFYPETDERREHTGLFFFKGRENAPFAVVCAGGGFSYVGSLHEGFPVALGLSKKGYNAFVLKYRAGNPDRAMHDFAKALEFIFDHAGELKVSRDGYSVWGGSAGARMAAYAGSYGTRAFGGKELPAPAVVVMAYTGYDDFTSDQPPTFMVVGENDRIADPRGMQIRAEMLKRNGVRTEFHLYPDLGHGFGSGTGTSAQGWTEKAVRFWEDVTAKK